MAFDRNKIFRTAALVMALTVLSQCSADHAAEPEPTLTTAGAFVAAQDEAGKLVLYRILSAVGYQTGQGFFFVTIYAAQPENFEHARELAQQRDLRISTPFASLPQAELATRNWRIAWFRSLTDEEREGFR